MRHLTKSRQWLLGAAALSLAACSNSSNCERAKDAAALRVRVYERIP